MHRFDDILGDDYYAFRRGDPNDLAGKLEALEVGQSLFADFAYAPWVIRARDMLGVELPARLAAWLEALEQRPSIAAEVESCGAMSAVSEIAVDELRDRLGEVAILDVRTPAEYDGTRPAVRPAAGAHPGCEESRRLPADGDDDGRGRAPSSGSSRARR